MGLAPRFDIHTHLAGVGTQRSGCWTSPSFQRRPTFLGLRLLFGITHRQLRSTVDQDWADLLSRCVAESDIDFAVALGFDGVYGSDGKLDWSRSQMIIPSRWVFEVSAKYGNLIPGPSINPHRRDAMDQLEEAIDSGAALIKWLPIVQAIDPAAATIRPFLQRLADSGVPLLVHAGGGEVTFATVAPPELGALDRLLPALDMGVKVICAHSAAPVIYSRQQSEIPRLRELLRKYENLWVDNSGLANPSRFPYLPRFAQDSLISGRTLHGSDFPVINHGFYYARQLRLDGVASVHREKNPVQREVLLKRRLGFREDSFTRAAGVLANLERWCR